MVQQILFLLVAAFAIGWAIRQFSRVRRNIMLGKAETINDHTAERWRNVLLVSFGQKKMFKRWIPAVLHFALYVAFVITQIELVEIFIDGIFGIHRVFAPILGGFYTFIISFIEVLSVLAFIATVTFLIRRNLLNIRRFEAYELKGWPKLDANLILIFEILLLIGIFCWNGADIVLQNRGVEYFVDTGDFAVTGWLGPALFGGLSEGTLLVIERFGWWLHIIMVFVFLNYIPRSKHLHIFLAFPNTYFADVKPKAEMENMPEVMNEVKSMMGLTEGGDAAMDMEAELPEFGVNDVFGLSWKNVLQAYSCTECGRCTDQCPANITGKLLSPRKIVMNVRDRAEEIGNKIESGKDEFKKDKEKPLSKNNFDDGRSLFDYITREELHACTTCMACVEACPVLINPLEPILKMRRYEILTESAGPQEWLPMFTSIENSGSAWQIPKDRDQWAKDAKEM